MSRPRRAIVVGAGIGGLTAAIALRRAGYTATVHERNREHLTTGGGLGIQANAIRALRVIDMAEPIVGAGQRVVTYVLRDSRGRLLRDMPINEAAARALGPGIPTVTITRGHLHEALLAGVGHDAVRLGARLERFEQDGTGVTAYFSDGSVEHGDLLIGADGLRSATRRLLLGDDPLRYSGFQTWIGMCAGTHPLVPAGHNAWYWGPAGKMVGVHDVGHGFIYWWGVMVAPQGSAPRGRTARQTALDAFGDWAAPIPELIEGTSDRDAMQLEEFDRAPVRRWGAGRVTLVGDAAHPMIAFLAQGASVTIEDAVYLAALLAGPGDDPEGALRRYERERIRRTTKIVVNARRTSVWQLTTKHVTCRLRDFAMGILPNAALERFYDDVLTDAFPDHVDRALRGLHERAA